MDVILSTVKFRCALLYLYAILILSGSLKEHIKHKEMLLRSLINVSLTLWNVFLPQAELEIQAISSGLVYAN